MPHVEFPKALYLRGWDDLAACVTVQDAAEEAGARAQGYRSLTEPVAEPEVGEDAPDAPKRRGRPAKATEA
jgi:hypothetical protein